MAESLVAPGLPREDLLGSRLRQVMVDEGREVAEVRAEEKAELFGRHPLEEPLGAPGLVVAGDYKQMSRAQRQHVADYAVDVVVAEPVTERDEDAVGPAQRRRQVAEKVRIQVVWCADAGVLGVGA